MTNKTNSKSNSRSRHIYIYILLFGLLITASFLSVMLGSVYINPADILKCFFTPDKTSVTYILIMNIRLPRMLGAIIAGMGLSVAGVILQGVMNNALASPNTIGVNSGAGYDVIPSFRICHIYSFICRCTFNNTCHICTCIYG